MQWLLKAVGMPLALFPSVVMPLSLVGAAELAQRTPDAPAAQAEREYRGLASLPRHAPDHGADRAALEDAAMQLAATLRAVPVDAEGTQPCPAGRLAVSWQAPVGAQWGAYLSPVGPAPSARTRSVNGVVVCQDSPAGFMGFEAWRGESGWQLAAVPFVQEHGEHLPADGHVHDADPPPAPPPAAPPSAPRDLGAAIEGYAAYEPQRLCDPSAKPGTVALRNLLLGTHPGTRNLGISRGCGVGGQSEHKEGRALDWGVLISRAGERQAAEQFIDQLMATDAHGNRHALARRMGVMYVIWNRRIWSSHRAHEGWRAYGGASPHTDHVHISLSWAGAQGRTSYWSGAVDPAALLAANPLAEPGAGRGRAATVAKRGGDGTADASGHHRRSRARRGGDDQQASPPAARDDQADRLDREQRRAARQARRQAAREAWLARRAQRQEAEQHGTDADGEDTGHPEHEDAPEPDGHGDDDGRDARRQRRRDNTEGREEWERRREAARLAQAEQKAEWERQRQEQREQRRQAEAQRKAEAERQRQEQRRAEREAAERAKAERRAERRERRQHDERREEQHDEPDDD